MATTCRPPRASIQRSAAYMRAAASRLPRSSGRTVRMPQFVEGAVEGHGDLRPWKVLVDRVGVAVRRGDTNEAPQVAINLDDDVGVKLVQRRR